MARTLLRRIAPLGMLAFVLWSCGKSSKTAAPTAPDMVPVSVALDQNCSTIALWNHDRVLAPSGVFGSVGVAAGGMRAGVQVRFRDAAGADLAFDPAEYSVAAEVAEPAIASATTTSGSPSTLTMMGLQPGHTTLQVVLRRGTREVYRTGNLPVVVGDSLAAAVQPFALIFNGVTVAASDGLTSVTTTCSRPVSPGSLEVRAGATTEHYFFRKLSPTCGLIRMEGPVYRFTYELDDPCIAALLIGDHPESLLTFHLVGRTVGQTNVRFQFYRHDTLEFQTPKFPVHVNPAP